MRIKVKSQDYHVSFKHEAGPPSVMADKLVKTVTAALQARVIAARQLQAARDARTGISFDTNALNQATTEEQVRLAESAFRKLPTPEQAVQRALDKIEKNLALAARARTVANGYISLVSGLGRSARRPYLKRTVATIWIPIEVEKEGCSVQIKRPKFEDPSSTQIVATGETKCSGLDVYIREEGRAIALARAACSLCGVDRDDLVSIGIQVFPIKATRGRQAYWKECAELRPELWAPPVAPGEPVSSSPAV